MAIVAGDVMTKTVVTVDPSLPALELERLLARERISGAPVVTAILRGVCCSTGSKIGGSIATSSAGATAA